MKWKTRIEVQVKSDPFKAVDKVLREEGVLSANVINARSIVVMFDNRKIKEADIKQIAA